MTLFNCSLALIMGAFLADIAWLLTRAGRITIERDPEDRLQDDELAGSSLWERGLIVALLALAYLFFCAADGAQRLGSRIHRTLHRHHP